MKKITCSLLLVLLVISASVGGYGWAGRTSGQTKARVEHQAVAIHRGVERHVGAVQEDIERQADAFQKGYATGYQQEKAKQNQQENAKQN